MFGLRTAFIVTESHELHRLRRSALAHYFSKASLLKLEPGVQSQVDKLMARFEDLRESGRNVNLLDVYACLTGDVIGQVSIGRLDPSACSTSRRKWAEFVFHCLLHPLPNLQTRKLNCEISVVWLRQTVRFPR